MGALALAALALPSLIQGGVGIAQLAKGASMKPERPEYEVPESATEALANAKYVASQTALPGADIFRSALRENMANSIFSLTQAATSPTQILEGVTKMNEQYANQEQQLAMQGAQNYYNNQGELRSELNTMAAREDQKWVANEYNPWLMDMERKQALMEGGISNISGGVTGALNLTGYGAEMDFIKDYYGNTGAKSAAEMGAKSATGKTAPITSMNPQPIGTGFQPTKPFADPYQGNPFQPTNDKGVMPNTLVRNPFKL